MSVFTPIRGLFGGSLIGLSAATLLLGSGEILGAAGIASSLVKNPRELLTSPSQQWKLVFMASFLATSLLWSFWCNPNDLQDPQLGVDPNVPIVSTLGSVVSGFLVGFGTKLGNGCTSGHGICGLARLSVRSLVAVVSFMTTGIAFATVCSPQSPLSLVFRADEESLSSVLPSEATKTIGAVLAAAFIGASIPALLSPLVENGNDQTPEEQDADINDKRKMGPAIISGSIFSAGLAISGMIKPSKIFGFLDMSGIGRGTYDPTLITVMGGGVVVSWISYQFVKGYNVFKIPTRQFSSPPLLKPSCGKFHIPTNKTIDADLIVGEAMFGLGWGIGGLCPGPAMFLAAAGFPKVLFCWWPSYLVGALLAKKLSERKAKQIAT